MEGELIEYTPKNEAPLVHHEQVEENIKIESKENCRQEEDVHAETTCITPLDQC